LLWLFCLSQKQAVEELRMPSSARWSSSVASAGSLMTGADCLKTFPPRSSTKWLCVATNANAIDRRSGESLPEEHLENSNQVKTDARHLREPHRLPALAEACERIAARGILSPPALSASRRSREVLGSYGQIEPFLCRAKIE
jgi:hypothetical protein